MWDWLLRILLFLICGPLWRLGGWGTEGKYPNPIPWTGWRDTLIPVLCCLYFGFKTASPLIGFISGITALIIRLGYGPNSILMKSLGLTDIQARTICGLIYGLIAFLPIACKTQNWITYLSLIIMLMLINWYMVEFNIGDIVTELCIGWTFGLAFLIYV